MKLKDAAPWISLAVTSLAAVVLLVVAIFVPGDGKTKLSLAIGYGLLLLVFMYGVVILIEILVGNIDLSALLSESLGKPLASMSRFQLLIFTFVISLSFFLIVASTGKFPDVPGQVLTLLGISASTYAVSKGIQASGTPAGGGEEKPKEGGSDAAT